MKTALLSIIVAVAVLLVSGPQARAEDTKAHQELQAIYNKLADAIKNKEIGGAADLVTADYVERDVFGEKHTRQQVQERLRKSLAATESLDTLHAEVLRVVTKGDHALALTRRKAAATIDDKDKKPHKMELESMTLDLWDKSGDTWKLARTEQLSLLMTLDGKAMRPVRRSRKRPARRAAAGAAALIHPGALMLAGPIHRDTQGLPTPREQVGAAPERVTKVAQFYTTPYNYGWGGNGYGYGYGYGYSPYWGYGAGLRAGTYQSRNNAYLTASVNAQNAPRQASIYQQQLAYERALKQHKKYQAYLKKEEAAMQARLQEEQAERAQQPQSTQ